MKFDVVVGNPPYNNDIYIPFVEMGHSIASTCSVFITPAKWQAKGGKKNEAFRQNIVPHMSKIVIEHNCKEIFDIQETSGISYFLIDKNIHDIKLIKNKCRVNSALDKDWEEHKDFMCWTNQIISIVNKCRGESIKDKLNYRRFEFTAEQERGHIKRNDNDVAVMQGQNIVGYLSENELFTTNNIEKYKVTSLILIRMQVIFCNSTKILGSQNYNILKPNQVPKGSFPVLRYFDSEDECKSFVSYFNSKLMSFLFFVGVCGGTLTQEFYRYIPDPITFDHIFTDEELYKKYNLTPEEINIIESVIKERKL
jgi:site-specific DNA-methyltransferase (adenine-specific)